MTVLEEKRNKVISNINNTDDEFLLDFITEITDLNQNQNEENLENNDDLNSENINPIIIQLIEKAEKQIENGEYFTHSEVKGIVNTWI